MSQKVDAMVKGAVAAVVAVGLSTASAPSMASSVKMEKCYGVVKKGQNDCGTSQHACAGQAVKDADKNEWLYLPKGTCDKLVGGDTQ